MLHNEFNHKRLFQLYKKNDLSPKKCTIPVLCILLKDAIGKL